MLRLPAGPHAVSAFALTGGVSWALLDHQMLLESSLAIDSPASLQRVIALPIFFLPLVWKGPGRWVQAVLLGAMLPWLIAMLFGGDSSGIWQVVLSAFMVPLAIGLAFDLRAGKHRMPLAIAAGFTGLMLRIATTTASSDEFPGFLSGGLAWGALALWDWLADRAKGVMPPLRRDAETSSSARWWQRAMAYVFAEDASRWWLLPPGWRKGWRGLLLAGFLLAAAISLYSYFVGTLGFQDDSFFWILAAMMLPLCVFHLVAWLRGWIFAGSFLFLFAPALVGPGPPTFLETLPYLLAPALGLIAGYGAPYSWSRSFGILVGFALGATLVLTEPLQSQMPDSPLGFFIFSYLIWVSVVSTEQLCQPAKAFGTSRHAKSLLPPVRWRSLRAAIELPLPERGLLAVGALMMATALPAAIVPLRASVQDQIKPETYRGEARPPMVRVPASLFYTDSDGRGPTTFAISQTEVSPANYAAIYANPQESEDAAVQLYEARHYCNLVSALENLESCYAEDGRPPSEPGQLRRCRGYRLPTREEWLYAAAAGRVDGREAQLEPNPWGIYELEDGA
ncbi:MAG: hypothetical protein AAF560_31495, partial [Acidobacteriota bacterium]